MRKISDSILRAFSDQQRVAYTALVETRGSTPQKAGAEMLVFDDGSQVGTLGGGCVEAEVKRQALQLLDAGQTEVLSFQLDDSYGWDDGLICGGRMRLIVDPIRPGDDVTYYRELADLARRGVGATQAVALNDAGESGDSTNNNSSVDAEEAAAEKRGGFYPSSDSWGTGDRWLFDSSGRCIAFKPARAKHPVVSNLSSVVVPAAVTDALQPVKQRPRPYVRNGIAYLPMLRRCRLVIVGAGHVGQMVARYASDADFDVWVVDDREEFCNTDRFPQAQRLIVAPIDTALSGLETDTDTFLLIVTRGHNHDEEALYHLAEKSCGYLGLIGSRRKIKLIFQDLLAERVPVDALRRVHAPIGLEIGSQTVPEIAISIVAELISVRNLGASHDSFGRSTLMNELPGFDLAASENRSARGNLPDSRAASDTETAVSTPLRETIQE